MYISLLEFNMLDSMLHSYISFTFFQTSYLKIYSLIYSLSCSLSFQSYKTHISVLTCEFVYFRFDAEMRQIVPVYFFKFSL